MALRRLFGASPLPQVRPRSGAAARSLLQQFVLEEPEPGPQDDAEPAPPPSVRKPVGLRTEAAPVPAAPAPPSPALPERPPPRLRPRGLQVDLGTTPDGSSLIWDAALQLNAFVAAVGSSGSGKTGLLRLFASSARAAGVPVVLLDVHGDLRLPRIPSYPIGRGGYSVNPLLLPGPLREQGASLAAAPLIEGAQLGRVQQQLLRDAVEQLLERPGTAGPPTVAALQQLLREQSGPSVPGLIAAVSSTYDPVAFSGRPLGASLLLTGAHVDLTPLAGNDRAQVLVVQALLTQLWGELQARGPVPAGAPGLRLLVVLDEASKLQHSPIVDRLVKEARKFGLGLCIAAQLPAELSEAVRTNAGTAVVLPMLEGLRKAADFIGTLRPEQVGQLRGPGDAWIRFRTAEGPTTERVQLRHDKEPA